MTTLLNRDSADQAARAIADPAVRKLVREALSTATFRFVQWQDLSDEQFHQQLPAAPFDLLFFEQLMETLFADPERIQRIIESQGANQPDDF